MTGERTMITIKMIREVFIPPSNFKALLAFRNT
jgi:hypothetical protein